MFAILVFLVDNRTQIKVIGRSMFERLDKRALRELEQLGASSCGVHIIDGNRVVYVGEVSQKYPEGDWLTDSHRYGVTS